LPDPVKTAVVAKLSAAHVSERTRKEFDNIIKFMIGGASMDGFMLRIKVADLDRKRQQNMVNVQPEFAKLIEYAGPD
jgi:hypothetical protein